MDIIPPSLKPYTEKTKDTEERRFRPAGAKLTIGSCEPGEDELSVSAQYNPRELTITQPITWTEHPPKDNQKSDAMYLDFGGMQPRTVQVEMLFDGAENGGAISTDSGAATVMQRIEALMNLARVKDPYSRIEEDRRPHFCVVSWGQKDFPRFRCVIDSVVVKYQMWDSDGGVLRATATVSLKEASRVGIAEKERPPNRVKPGAT